MPPPIIFRPPYHANFGCIPVSTTSAQGFTREFQNSDVNGMIQLTSLAMVGNASDSDWAISQVASGPAVFVEPNGNPPGSIITRFRPVSVVIAGQARDEFGVSALTLNVRLRPWGWIDFGGGWVPLAGGTPASLFAHNDTNPATHNWFPPTWNPPGNLRAVQWSTPAGLQPNQPFWLLTGVEIFHSAVVNDVSIASFVQATVQTELISVQMS